MKKNKGFILISVLIICLIIMCLTLKITENLPDDNAMIRTIVEQKKAKFAFISGINTAASIIINESKLTKCSDTYKSKWNINNMKINFENNDFIIINCFDENSKLPLNFLDVRVLKKIFSKAGIDKEKSLICAESFLDWIDPESVTKRFNGYENADYNRMGYKCKDYYIESFYELENVKGFEFLKKKNNNSKSFITILNQFSTPYYEVKKININTASPEILEILFEDTIGTDAVFFKEYRKKNIIFKNITDFVEIFGIAGREYYEELIDVKSEFFNLEIFYTSSSKNQYICNSLLQRTIENGNFNFKIIKWKTKSL